MQDQSLDELDELAEELTLRVDVRPSGTIGYYNSDGQLHRIHGPAIILSDGTKFWYQNGKRHRLDAPAVIWANGVKYWYIDGIGYTEEEFNNHPLVIVHRAKNAL